MIDSAKPLSFFDATRQDGVEAHHLEATLVYEIERLLPHAIHSSLGTAQSTKAMLGKGLKELHDASGRIAQQKITTEDVERQKNLSDELKALEDFQQRYMTISDEDPSRKSPLTKFISNLLAVQDLVPNIIRVIKQYLESYNKVIDSAARASSEGP